MPSIVRELPITKADAADNPKEQYQQETREEIANIVDAFGLVTDKEALRATATRQFVANGKFPMGAFSAATSRLSSAGGTKITKATAVSATATIISDMDFSEGITMTAAATAIFNGCRFSKEITMASGAKAAFVGCVFDGTAYINNAGAAASAGIVGCLKTSSTAHVNVTTIFEI